MATNKNVKHIVTQEDLINNPALTEKNVNVGDAIDIVSAIESKEVIKKLESSLESFNSENESLKSQLLKSEEVIKNLENQIKDFSIEKESLNSQLTSKNQEIELLKSKSVDGVSEQEHSKNTDGKVIVHFPVKIGGKTYSVQDILNDKDIQQYLLEIGSGSIELVDKG